MRPADHKTFVLHCIAFLHNLAETCYRTLSVFSIVPCTTRAHSDYMLPVFAYRVKQRPVQDGHCCLLKGVQRRLGEKELGALSLPSPPLRGCGGRPCISAPRVISTWEHSLEQRDYGGAAVTNLRASEPKTES